MCEVLTCLLRYSALKMDGKPLYEYARQNLPLPKPIEARNCTISHLELTGFKSGEEHSWVGAKEDLSQEEKDTMNKLEALVQSKVSAGTETASEDAVSETVPEASTSDVAAPNANERESAVHTEGSCEFPYIIVAYQAG